ncbi:glycosyltransferase family 59 protein, partial [Sodiomyces alcalophilus JCM 7366]|uniref:glycosyltransferase family 59 protein n=1 Tax=Sodiomyces alcalophilus JCM 7366 TaxID=591952 RepID=UPI0039B6E3E8
LLAFGSIWYSTVNRHVPNPYLDEVFHIPQAQTYCRDKFFEWDDKITTPPGLYLISRISAAAKARLFWTSVEDQCDPAGLRLDNLMAAILLFPLAVITRHRIERCLAAPRSKQPLNFVSRYAIQTGLNVALFPVLFFYSGLYYTDVFSTLAVLLAYNHHIGRVSRDRSSLISDAWTILLGVMALFMRQTNIFWVVVYMGGLEAVHAIKSLHPKPASRAPMHTVSEHTRYFMERCSVGDIHDPSIDLAWPHDLCYSIAGIGLAAICNPIRVLKQVWPHITVMGLFTAFVAWNGGVVLGDKSNHIATIHLAQMLYIWPLFAFFSAPLFTPTLLRQPLRLFGSLNSCLVPKSKSASIDNPHQSASSGPSDNKESRNDHTSASVPLTSRDDVDGLRDSPYLRAAKLIQSPRAYGIPLVFLIILASWLIVVKNTIIHPFTLADNRHYMFYIFRYTIRRPGHFREYLVGVYLFSGWFCWSALSALEKPSSPDQHNRCVNSAAEPASSSTIVLLFVATALSLITAPLVEPRYFILPWIFWRLLVPAWHPEENSRNHGRVGVASIPGLAWFVEWGRRYDLRLVLETLWFLIINAVTMCIFIYRPYVWRNEHGEVLDGGRLQRFMW